MFSSSLRHRAAARSREESDRKSSKKVHTPAPHNPGQGRRTGEMEESGNSGSKHKKKCSIRAEHGKRDKVRNKMEALYRADVLLGWLDFFFFLINKINRESRPRDSLSCILC